jgi:hypothetical protein
MVASKKSLSFFVEADHTNLFLDFIARTAGNPFLIAACGVPITEMSLTFLWKFYLLDLVYGDPAGRSFETASPHEAGANDEEQNDSADDSNE